MIIIDPYRGNDFLGARSYCSSIDVPLFEKAKSNGTEVNFKKHIEREWKVLLLTKNIVVTGASAMISEFGYQLFSEYPILLQENLILPAVGNHVIGEDWENGADVKVLVEYYLNRLNASQKHQKQNIQAFLITRHLRGPIWAQWVGSLMVLQLLTR